MAKNIVIGAVSGAATFGIGEIASTIKVGEEALSISSQVLRGTAQAAMHGVMQGAIAGISGGDFAQGFVSGALASVASSAFAFDGNGAEGHLGWASSVRESKVGLIAFGSISGGVGAALTGGNFWQGAAIGLIVSGLNHAMHEMDYEESAVEDETLLQEHDGKIPSPNPKEMDPRYKVNGKQWRNVGGRETIVNDKGEVFQWDSQHGEIEVYDRSHNHKGGFDPYDRSSQTRKAIKTRNPNGSDRMPSSRFFDAIKGINLPSIQMPLFNEYILKLLIYPQNSYQGTITI